MLRIDLKPLFSRLSPLCTMSLEQAAGITLSRLHYEITPEHFLLGLLEQEKTDLECILTACDIDIKKLIHLLDQQLQEYKSGNSGRPVFSPLLTDWIQESWLVGSLSLGEETIRSGALLLTLLLRADYYLSGSAWGRYLSELSAEQIEQRFFDLTANSQESASTAVAKNSAASALAKYCENFTAKARDGKIDPVLGRDDEIRQIIDILGRRRKNNPICLGEPGVGKTAVIEGLALRIIHNEVPVFLHNTQLLSLDLGLLEAGASVKGEFEKRLKAVIDEIQRAIEPIILFIDEAHMLIGSGGNAGGNDAANLLKPALARGELRTIAATTWAEYKKYFERDAALTRRFQVVKLEAPSVAISTQILRGIKEKYEESHGVSIRDDAIVSAVELSNRYIVGRMMPDKAIDLLDTACARIKINLDVEPAGVERLKRQSENLEREKVALLRDQAQGHPIDIKRIHLITEQLAQRLTEQEALNHQWQTQKKLALSLIEKRKEPQPSDELRASIQAEKNKLTELQQEQTLVFTEVTPDTIAQVVSDWTGVPLGKMQRDSAEQMLSLAARLKQRIQGQSQGLDLIAATLKSAQAGLRDPSQPLGVFLLTGPSGVGKTETAIAIADELFGGEGAINVVNMSEYQEKHTTSRLIGSPPGYVGYGEGGVLTEAVRKRPYSVVLLDEVEKGHLDVLNLFYPVFDKGSMADGEGRIIDFSNTVIFLTSNLATNEIMALTQHQSPSFDEVTEKIRPLLSHHFKPALLARMNIVPFYALSLSALETIVKHKLQRLATHFHQANKAKLTFAKSVIKTIAARCTEVETGARNIDFILRNSVLPLLAEHVLLNLSEAQPATAWHVSLDEHQQWLITAEGVDDESL